MLQSWLQSWVVACGHVACGQTVRPGAVLTGADYEVTGGDSAKDI